MKTNYFVSILILGITTASLFLVPHANAAAQVVLYSGRSKSLVDPLIKQFQRETGIKVVVKYANTAQLALTLQEEGSKSPAHVFWAQDAGALGAVSKSDLFATLPNSITSRVDSYFVNSNKTWIATSGRARVLAYAPDRVKESELPGSIFELSDP